MMSLKKNVIQVKFVCRVQYRALKQLLVVFNIVLQPRQKMHLICLEYVHLPCTVSKYVHVKYMVNLKKCRMLTFLV